MSDPNNIEIEIDERVGNEPSEDRPQPSANIVSDEEQLEEILTYLLDEKEQAVANRSDVEERWKKWRRQLENLPEMREKNYPIRGASNVSVPLAQIMGQTMYAKLKTVFDAKNPFWLIQSMRDREEDHKDAELLTKYYEILSKSPSDLNLSKKKRTVFLESGVMGTCFVKVPWVERQWFFRREEDGVEEQVNATLHQGPSIEPVPVEDIVYPQGWDEIGYLPWISHQVHLPEHELRNREAAGIYENVDQVLNSGSREHSTEAERDRDQMRGYRGEREGIYDLDEFTFFWDVNGDGTFEDVVFTVHIPSRTVLRQSYNEVGIRIFEPFVFMHRTFELDGRGTGQMTESLQDEINGIHNVRNDNMKIANMRMFAMRRSVATSNKENVYPGKIWITDDPANDIAPIQLGEVYPSSLEAEQLTMNYAEQATGFSEVTRGFADPTLGTRDTAAGQKMRIMQSQSIFSSISEGIQESWSRVGTMVFYQLVHHRKAVIARERRIGRLSEEEISRLERILSIPVDEIPFRLTFSIRTADIDQSHEAKRQNYMTLSQLFQQYAQQTMPLAMQLFGQQGQQMLRQAPEVYNHMLQTLTSSTKLLEEIFDFFGVENTQSYVPDTERWERLDELIREMKSQMPMGGFFGGGQQQPGQPGQNGVQPGQPGQMGAGVPGGAGTAPRGGEGGGNAGQGQGASGGLG